MFYDHLVALSFKRLRHLASIPNSKGTLQRGREIHGGGKIWRFSTVLGVNEK